MTEHRHFHRVQFVANTDVTIGGTSYATTLVDISLKGALVSFHADVPAVKGDECVITVHLHASDVVLPFEGVIVHSHDNVTGIKFTRIAIETMVHLRRLIELNTADADLVRSELSSFIDAE